MVHLTHEGQTSMDLASPVNPAFARPMTPAQLLKGFIAEFDSLSLPIIPLGGEPSCIAREFGLQAGFANDGGRFISMVRDEWAPFFIEGVHYVILSGEPRREYLKALEVVTYSGTTSLKYAKSFMVLLAPGIWTAISKCEGRLGVAFSHLMSRVIMPRFSTGETVSIEAIQADAAPAPTPAEIPDTLEKRKIEVRKIAEERRTLEARIKAAEALGDILTPLERKALILGEETPSASATSPTADPKPESGPPTGWKMASQIARERDLTPRMVGILITKIEDRGQPMRDGVPGISALAPVQLSGDKGEVKTNHYSPEGVRLIVREIEAWRAEKAEEERALSAKKAVEARSRKNRAQVALLEHSDKMAALGHGDEFDRMITSWRNALGADFVLKTHITAISSAIKKHGVGVAQVAVMKAINTDTPANPTERLRKCINAAAMSSTGSAAS